MSKKHGIASLGKKNIAIASPLKFDPCSSLNASNARTPIDASNGSKSSAAVSRLSNYF